MDAKRLAIVGSEDIPLEKARSLIEAALDRHQATILVSGGAQGIDSWAEQIAKERGLETEIYRPSVKRWGARGGYRDRNKQIAKACDALVRIVSSRSKSYGAGWTRDRAAALGKPTEELVVEMPWDGTKDLHLA